MAQRGFRGAPSTGQMERIIKSAGVFELLICTPPQKLSGYCSWRATMPGLDLLYRLYTKRLLAEIKRHSVPRHVGLILDGNRRYARLMGFQNLIAGHARGAEKVEELLDWCFEVGITTVTIWILSP